jgi:hypothetical protein
LPDRRLQIARALLHASREQFVDKDRSHASSFPWFEPADKNKVNLMMTGSLRRSAGGKNRKVWRRGRTADRRKGRARSRECLFLVARPLGHQPRPWPGSGKANANSAATYRRRTAGTETRPSNPTRQIVVVPTNCGEQWIIRRLNRKLKKTWQISRKTAKSQRPSSF